MGCTSPVDKKNDVVYQSFLSLEENIAAQATVLQNDSTYPFLDHLAKTRSVILVGEAEHGDSVTSVVKSRMQRYLLDKGFHSIAYEAVPFLTGYVFSNPKYNTFTDRWRVESPSDEIIQFFNARRTENINRIWGIDVYAGDFDIKCAKAILSEYFEEYMFFMDWEKLNNYYISKCVLGHDIPVSEQTEMMRMIDRISNYAHYVIHKKTATNDLKAVLQWIRNVNTNYSVVEHFSNPYFRYGVDLKNTPPLFTLSSRNRDAQIAENILWITEHFPEEKFMVWVANYHGIKDISQTTYPYDSLMYFTHQCAGEAIYNQLGTKFYSLAITSLNREGSPDDINKGFLESAIAKQTHDAPYAFIDFERLRFVDGFRDKEFDAAMIGKKKGKWLYMFDGIYYIRDEKLFDGWEKS
jgi:hypothetical protein